MDYSKLSKKELVERLERITHDYEELRQHTVKDITDRKQMEIEVQRSEALYSSILNVSPDSVILTDLTAMVVYVSPAIFKLYNSTDIHDYLGHNLFEFMLESDRERAMLNTRRRLEGEQLGALEYTGVRKDGSQFYFDVDSDVIKDEQGRPTNILYVIRDITARKHTEQKLRLSEEKYRLITEKITDIVWLMDLNGVSTYVSKSIEKFTGYTVDEYLKQSIQDRFTPESVQKAYSTLQLHLENWKSGLNITRDYQVHLELDYLCKNGEIKTGELLISPVFDESGSFKIIHGVTRDITDRKAAEKALKESESKYRNIFETVQDAYYEVSADGITLEISPSIESISRGVVTRDDLIGKSFVSFYKDPHERELLQQELALKGYVTDYEITFSYGDIVVPVSITSSLILNPDGNPMKIIGSIRDISERKKSEKQLRDSEALYHSILTASPDNITICDLQGNIELVSPAGLAMFGCSVDEMVGQSLLEFVDEPDRARALENVRRMFEGCFERAGRYAAQKKDGTIFPVEVNGEFLRDTNGKPTKLIFVVRDITDRIVAEERLQESERKYKTFFDENKSIMLMIEPETGLIRDANATACEFYGWSKEELCSMNISQINPLSVDEIARNLRNTVAEKRKIHHFRHVKKDGSMCDVEVYAGAMTVDNKLMVYSIVHDITERKRIEEQLKESEERFRMIFDNVFDGISIFEEHEDPSQRRLIDCNEQFASMAGRSKDELLKIGYTFSLTEPIGENMNKYRLSGLTNQAAYQGAFRWLRPDGEENTIQYIARPITWQGKLFSIGIDRDVTETKRREIQLKKLSQVVEQSPVSIVITGLDGSIEYANPEACKTTGYEIEELIGANPRVLQSGLTSKEQFKEMWELISNGKDWHGMFHNKRKNGELYWESSTLAPIFDDDGRIVNYVAIKEDVTERKKEQEELLKFKTIADSSNSGTSIASLDGEILYLNSSFARMLGCEIDYVIGKNIAMIYHHSNYESMKELSAEIFEKGGIAALEIWIQRQDLTVFPALFNITVIYNEKNEPIYLTATCVDVTEMVKAEELLRESESALNYAQEIAGMGSWMLDLIQDRLTGSANYYRMLGLNPFQENIDLYDYFKSIVHAGDLGVVDYIANFAFEKAETKIFEFRIVVSDNVIWIRNFIQPVFDDDKLVALRGVNIDVTDERNRESQISRLSQAVFQSPVGVVVTDVKGIVEYVNPAFESMTGFSAEHMLGQSTRILKSGKNSPEVYADLWKTILSGKVWDNEWINIRKNGQYYWEHISISPMFDTAGEIINFLAIKQDITERKRFEEEILALNSSLEIKVKERTLELAKTNTSLLSEIQERERFENALKDSEYRYRSVVENIQEVVFQTDNDGKWLFLNKSWEIVTGFSIDESIGEVFLNYVHPEDRERNLSLFAPLINKEKDYCRHEIRYLTKEGGFRWIEVFARLGVDENNHPIGTYGTLRDVTERKQAEELLQWNKSLLEMMSNSSPLGFLVVDNDNDKILYFNKRFCEIWGVEWLEEKLKTGEVKNMDLVSHCLTILVDPENFKKTGISLRDVENRAVVSDEIQFKGNRTIHRYSTQIRGADDRYFGRFYIFEDVTEAKKAEDELISARNEADDANRAKSEFLSRMSHELRTPLNSILGFAQLLEMGELNAKQQKGVGHILRSGKHLLSLINDVLDISRIESGRISISIEPVQLRPVFDEMIDVLKPISAGKNITMQLEDSLCNNCFVKADRQSLKQVLVNLLNNAIKYNRPDGMVNISAQLVADEPTGVEQIRISLIDTGIGIASEDIQKIFTPFERIGAEKSGIEGTGLGLAVVKKLVDAMGGKLGVESVPGEGSTFWVQFERAESLLHAASMVNAIASDSEGVHTRKATILYIEDNASNIELVEQILHSQRPDIRLMCNMTGKQTVKLAIEYKPDLIMLDLNLPDIHGSEVIKELMKNPNTKDIPVVVVSADAMNKQVETLMASGAKAYLTKPLEIKLFLDVLDDFTKE